MLLSNSSRVYYAKMREVQYTYVYTSSQPYDPITYEGARF